MVETTLRLGSPFALARGEIVVVPIPNPAAGAGFTRVVPGGWVERLIACHFQLATDANAANRGAVLLFEDGDGNILAYVGPVVQQTATNTFQHSYARGLGASYAQLARVVTPLPQIDLLAGWRTTLTVANVRAGDQLSNIRLTIERFAVGADGYTLGAQAETFAEALGELD